jgi:hypothetical protein
MENFLRNKAKSNKPNEMIAEGKSIQVQFLHDLVCSWNLLIAGKPRRCCSDLTILAEFTFLVQFSGFRDFHLHNNKLASAHVNITTSD